MIRTTYRRFVSAVRPSRRRVGEKKRRQLREEAAQEREEEDAQPKKATSTAGTTK